MYNTKQLQQLALAVIEAESQAICKLSNYIDANFTTACELLLNCQSRIVVTGMGKSGHIGKKIAATLASTGSPAFFVHPAEAQHGDLGMITKGDVLIAISYSGVGREVLEILPHLKLLNIPIISITGNPDSSLAKNATVNLNVAVDQEACPLNLAPTSSTTATLVMGDVLAIALLQAKGFTAEDFAKSHPKGTLGRRLLLMVQDLMHTGDSIPMVTQTTTLKAALVEMTKKRLGLTLVVDDQQKLLGTYTDGDLRRSLDRDLDIHTTQIDTVMNKNCKTIAAEKLATEALRVMEDHKITSLVIVNDIQQPIGVIHMHDILNADINAERRS